MGIFKRNRTFLVGAVLLMVVGAVLFGSILTVRVLGAAATVQALPVTLTGPNLPADTDQAAFEAQMAQSSVFQAPGSITITAQVTPTASGPGVVEGYLVREGVPRDSGPSSPDAIQIDLTGEGVGQSMSFDVTGNYYVMAAGQDCEWTLTVTAQVPSYNSVSSYGMTGYAPLTIAPGPDTPEFITKRLDEKRGIVLLVYVQGAADDMEMLSYFNDIKANYAADSSFFSFEARESKQLGDTLTQLRVSDPPILAVIRGDGTVAQLYTGWIGFKVMEQEIADAVRGL